MEQRGFAFLLRKPFDAESLFAAVGQHTLGASLNADYADIIRAYFKALTESDWDRLASLCTEDVQYHLPGDDPQFSRTIRGRQQFRDFPGAVFSIESLIPLPNAVVARYRGAWMAKPDERVEVPGSVIFHFREDAISQIGVRLEVKQLLTRAN